MKSWIRSTSLALAFVSLGTPARPAAEHVEELDISEEVSIDTHDPEEQEPEPSEADEGDLIVAEESVLTDPQPLVSQNPYVLRFRVAASGIYDDNIFIQEKDPVDDFIWSIAPGVTLGLGDVVERKGGFVAFDYDADAYFFSNHSELNSVDHDVSLRAQWAGAKLTLGGYVNFRDLTGANTETGDRVNRQLYEAGVIANYAWSEITTLGSELNVRISDYENHFDTRESNLRLWADYEVSPLTKLGLGVTLGQADVSEGSMQAFQQLLARVNYAAASKVDLALEAGGELRQIEDGNSQATPVFSLAASYSPYELLKIRLHGYRRVQPSIIEASANTVLTGVGLNVSYRFLRRFDLNLGGTYEHATYEAYNGNSHFSRDDNYFLLHFGVGYAVADNVRVGAFYQYRTNNSTHVYRSFDNQQTGIEVSFAF